MSLATVKKTFERYGRKDPLFAVLSRKGLRNNRWDPEEFFRTGVREIGDVLEYVDSLDIPLARQTALDFGCGVGRLSQGLAEHFERVVGVDIAESMVEQAREYNRHGDRVRYLVNTTDRLAALDDAAFDFIYTNKTLQHIPPEPAGAYVREFFRVLRPGGVVVFQVPNGRPYKAGSFGAWLYAVRRGPLRRFWKVVRGRSPVEMHYIPRSRIESIVAQGGARLVDVVDVGKPGRPRNESLRYCAAKE